MIGFIDSTDEKRIITKQILDALPAWFGIEESKQEYVDQSKDTFMFAYFDKDTPVGFIAIKQHYRQSAELAVMGVKSEYHRHGIGRKLVSECEKWCVEHDISYLQVKTLSETSSDESYAKTRKFYESVGFVPLETFSTIWDEANPCLLLVKYLNI